MSRLEEYLRTPNPIHPQLILTPHSMQTPQDILFPPTPPCPLTYIPPYTPMHPFPILQLDAENLSIDAAGVPPNAIHLKLEFSDDVEDGQDRSSIPVEGKIMGSERWTTAKKSCIGGGVQGDCADRREFLNDLDRTLKVLTAEAYGIVCAKGSTTYREVSDLIINGSIDMPNEKEQKNITRRIYDALNVLIALGKLQKRGRRIQLASQQIREQYNKKQKLSQLKQALKKKHQQISTKRQQHQSTKHNIKTLKSLLERNTVVLTVASSKQIHMPFIVTEFQNISLDHNQRAATISLGEKDIVKVKVKSRSGGKAREARQGTEGTERQSGIVTDLDAVGLLRIC